MSEKLEVWLSSGSGITNRQGLEFTCLYMLILKWNLSMSEGESKLESGCMHSFPQFTQIGTKGKFVLSEAGRDPVVDLDWA